MGAACRRRGVSTERRGVVLVQRCLERSVIAYCARIVVVREVCVTPIAEGGVASGWSGRVPTGYHVTLAHGGHVNLVGRLVAYLLRRIS